MNGKIKMKLENGKEVELALNFASLYKIRGLKKDVYDRYNKVIMKGTEDTFDTVTILYTAYLCANVDNLDEDIEDYYTYYVLILEISEDLFWNADFSFLKTVALNKSAYDSWKNYAISEECDRAYGKN